jgi:uncharacterized protein YbbC (DUF1343 family)
MYPWIPPSPNLPSWEAVLLYPALVLLEGTNISEGRGTSLPFTCFGAPGLNHHLVVDYINHLERGVQARPVTFTPQTSKFVGQDCHGVHLLLTDPLNMNAFEFGIRILMFLKAHYSDFQWINTAKNKDAYFIDYLVGTNSLRQGMEESLDEKEILEMLKA